MKSTLIDAGPMIALFDRDDRFHTAIRDFLRIFSGKLVSTWPVLTEVLHMLDFNTQVQIDFLKWIQRGAVEIYEPLNSKVNRFIELTQKYDNVPMDLADASFVIIAEETGIKEIITIDSDYYIYRTAKKEMLVNVFEVGKRQHSGPL